MFRSLSTFVCIPAFAFLTGAALAQTPDGQTPVNEGVCDELMESGITKGLFGLCVAFCEAQDCDGDGGGELPGSCQHSAETASRRPAPAGRRRSSTTTTRRERCAAPTMSIR
jgi:hypothetical protein